MENNQLSNETTRHIINDLKEIVNDNKTGKINLNDYVDINKEEGCMDFAMVYEMSDELKNFVNEERMKGKNIQVNEDNITVI